MYRWTHSSSDPQSASQPHEVGQCQQQQRLSSAYEGHALDECLCVHQRELASDYELAASSLHGPTMVDDIHVVGWIYHVASQLYGPVLQMKDAHATAQYEIFPRCSERMNGETHPNDEGDIASHTTSLIRIARWTTHRIDRRDAFQLQTGHGIGKWNPEGNRRHEARRHEALEILDEISRSRVPSPLTTPPRYRNSETISTEAPLSNTTSLVSCEPFTAIAFVLGILTVRPHSDAQPTNSVAIVVKVLSYLTIENHTATLQGTTTSILLSHITVIDLSYKIFVIIKEESHCHSLTYNCCFRFLLKSFLHPLLLFSRTHVQKKGDSACLRYDYKYR